MKPPKLIFLIWLISITAILGQIPRTMNYQGKLTDPAGVGINDTLGIEFTLYDTLEDGSPLWNECDTVAVIKGLFDVLLGSTNPFPDSLDFNEAYYIEIAVEGETLSPRVILSSAPYALRAAIADSAVVAPGGIALTYCGSDSGATPSTQYGRLESVARCDHTHWGQEWYGDGTALTINATQTGGVFTYGLEANVYNEGTAGSCGILGYSTSITGDGNTRGIWGFATNSLGSASSEIVGVRGTGSGSSTGNIYGAYLSAYRDDGSIGDSYGVYAIAKELTGGSATGTHYGIYATASDATINWAGYFDGNVFLNDTLFFGTPERGITNDAGRLRYQDIGGSWIDFSGGGGGVTSISQGTGVTCSPNPITATGTISFDQTWGDGRYIRSADDFGRSGVASDLYEGTTALWDKYFHWGTDKTNNGVGLRLVSNDFQAAIFHGYGASSAALEAQGHNNIGIYAKSSESSSDGKAIFAEYTGSSSSGYAVYADGGDGVGLWGESSDYYGVVGIVTNNSYPAVFGKNNLNNCLGALGYGDWGVYGNDGTGTHAGYFDGDVQIWGKLTVSGGVDPTYLSLYPQSGNPMDTGMLGIWIDESDSTLHYAVGDSEYVLAGPCGAGRDIAGRGLSRNDDTLNTNVRDGLEVIDDSLQIKDAGVGWEKLNEETKDSIRAGLSSGGLVSGQIVLSASDGASYPGFTQYEHFYIVADGNSTSDYWAQTCTTGNCPCPRNGHTAVWTGSEMIIWGGTDSLDNKLYTGARYNPETDTWFPTSTSGDRPDARGSHTAVWTGTEMIIFGGVTSSGRTGTGSRYNPLSDTLFGSPWLATSTTTDFSEHTAVWTGNCMIIWGGVSEGVVTNKGKKYYPSTNSWNSTSTGANCPTARKGHTAIWTGTEMIIWGGYDGSSEYLNTGGRYNPSTNAWSGTDITGDCPSPRRWHTAVWTGTEMIIWGGYNSSGYLNDGAKYNPNTNTWTSISETDCPNARRMHAAVFGNGEMFIWGGEKWGSAITNGARYNPVEDIWRPLSLSGTPPEHTEVRDVTAVWAGSEMIVWGGEYYLSGWKTTNTGGIYYPGGSRMLFLYKKD
ncbi:hypothetical protein DRQ36_10340 [bacterium]|nr:MAG: hypothetical protein DRQ36_10340 [bacterium]